jgi:hypothetical protein
MLSVVFYYIELGHSQNNMQVIILGHRKEDAIRQNKNLIRGAAQFSCSLYNVFFVPWRYNSGELRPPHYRELTITFKHTTLGRTPLDE